MTSRDRPPARYLCFLCGADLVTGPGFCTVGFHTAGELRLNAKGNGYAGFFQQGVAHLHCLEETFGREDDETRECRVCRKPVGGLRRSLQLAVYVYRRRGCERVVPVHEACFRRIKRPEFPLIRT